MRCAVFLLAFTSASLGCASAWVDSIEVQPYEPFVGDTATVVVGGGAADLCWSVEEITWVWVTEDSLLVDIYTYDCAFRECAGCHDAAFQYEESSTFVPVAWGFYTVVATDYRDSLRDPGENQIALDFVVEERSPIRESSWGRIKQLYR